MPSSDANGARLTGAPLALARAAWIVMTLILVGLLVAAVPLAYQQIITAHTGPQCADSRFSPVQFAAMHASGVSPVGLAVWIIVVQCYSTLVYVGVAALLFWRRSENRTALLTAAALVALGTTFSDERWLGAACALRPAWPVAAALFQLLGEVGSLLVPVLFFTFPSGKWVPRWSPWLFLCLILVWPPKDLRPAVVNVFLAGHQWIENVTGGLIFATLLFAQVYRYRRVSTPAERLQTKWVVLGSGLGLGGVAAMIGWGAFGAFNPTAPWWPLFLRYGGAAIQISFTLIPISIGIALFRSQLFDIDLIINRTLVYGVLTALIVGFYIIAVGSLGSLFQTRGELGISLLATGVVAVGFQPLRELLQRGVNRLMYGERDDPFAVVSRLGERLEGAFAPDAMLGTLVTTIAQSLKLPYVAIELGSPADSRIAACVGQPVTDPEQFMLTFQREVFGQLLVGPRAAGEKFNLSERHLLANIARQAGVAVHATQLAVELQRSRAQLVTAREEERRRLRRDLHDGLGPTLAALHLQAGTVRRLIRKEPETAETMVDELKGELKALVEDIRRLSYELRPPALDELGLVGAIQSLSARMRLSGTVGGSKEQTISEHAIHIQASGDFESLPAAVEVAAYHIVQEALLNSVRHARASHYAVRLDRAEALTLEIMDNGEGLPPQFHAGVGLLSMRERAGELGGWCAVESPPQGGTIVRAHLPVLEP